MEGGRFFWRLPAPVECFSAGDFPHLTTRFMKIAYETAPVAKLVTNLTDPLLLQLAINHAFPLTSKLRAAEGNASCLDQRRANRSRSP